MQERNESDKICVSLRNTNTNAKPWLEIRLEGYIRELGQANAKEEKTYSNIMGWKDQNKTAEMSDNTTWKHKSKDIGKRRETWAIPGQGEEIQTKQTLQNIFLKFNQ